MLLLSRKAGDRIVVGDNIELTVAKINGNRVTIGVEVLSEVTIRRGELLGLDKAEDVDTNEPATIALQLYRPLKRDSTPRGAR